MGESILLLLCDGEQVLFSVLTDCYCTGKDESLYNHVDSIFKEYDVNHLDAFVWTHPDKDHSVGIERTLGLYDKMHTAEIFVPDGLVSQMKEGGTFCQEARDAVRYLYENYSAKGSRKDKRHIHTVSTIDREVRDLLTLDFVADDEIDPLQCKFRFVLPDDDSCHHTDFWDMELEHNLMSIVYSLEMNGRNYLFTGDLMDDNTKKIHEVILSRINYVKIPHHGSEHSSEFQNILRHYENYRLTSATTRYNSSGDPKPSTLKAYCDMGKVFFVTDKKEYKVGCIETIVNVMTDISVTTCKGNASQFFNQIG